MLNDIDNIELRSDNVKEILEEVPHWMIKWGNILFLFLILLILSLSWFFKYPDIIISEAIITTGIPPEKKYARVTGKLETLFVQDGQMVNKGAPMAIIENTAQYQDVFLLKKTIDSIKIYKDSFRFPLDSLPVLFVGELESDFASFENAYYQYLINEEFQPYSNQETANKSTLNILRGRLENLNSQYEINKSELQLNKNDLKRSKTLYEKGVISKQEFENKQLEYLQAERNLKNINLNVAQTREAINDATLSSKNTKVNRTKEEKQLLRKVIQSFNELKSSLKDWELKYLFQSQIEGKVSFLSFWAKGQTVNAGDVVFSIIPSQNSRFLAKLKTPSLNSGKVKVGQSVNLNIENYPENEFGTLVGKVEKISLVPDAEGFYMIDVSLPKELITTYDKKINFKQEMRAQSKIITQDLRLIERLFYQFRQLAKR